MKKKSLAILFLSLFLISSLSALQIMGTNGVNSASCTIGLINSTSFIYRNVTASAVGAYYYMPVGGTPTLLNADLAWGSFDSNGMPVVMETAQNRVWFIETSQTSSAWLVKYFDLASKTTSANVFSLGWGGASPNGLGIALNNSQMVFGGAVVSSVKSWLWSGFTNGTLVFANSTAVGNGKYSNPAMNILAFDGKYYLGTPNAIIHLISASSLTSANATVETNETLSAISTGTESAPFLFTIGIASFPYMLFSSNEAGNQELYWAITNQTASKTRLTATGSVNETLESAWQSPYGTVYLVYSNNTAAGGTTCVNKNLTMTLDYFCPLTNSALGVVCAGETGYGGSGTESGGSIPNNITQDVMQLSVVDNGRCSSGCIYGLDILHLTNEDWIKATFTINGQQYNNATCIATDGVSNANLVSCSSSLTYPGGAGDLACGNGDYVAQVSPIFSNKLITVSCVNPVNSTQAISVPFLVENTPLVNRQNGWYLHVSGIDKIFDDIVKYKELIRVRNTLSRPQDNTGGSGNCYVTLGSSIVQPEKLSATTQRDDNLIYQFEYDYFTSTSNFAIVPAGYNYYKAACGSWFVPNQRLSSNAEIRRLYAYDLCIGNYQGTSSIATRFFVDSAIYGANHTFYQKQEPVVQVAYSAEFYANATSGIGGQINPICSVTLTNDDTATDLWSITVSGDMFQTKCLPTTNRGCSTVFTLPMVDQNANPLISGNYSLAISCDNNNPDACIATSTAIDNFTVLDGAGCSGTIDSCGTTVCNACSGTNNFQCENGEILGIPQDCINQKCSNQTDVAGALRDYIESNKCSIYGVQTGLGNRRDSFSCLQKPSTIFYAAITKQGTPFDANGNGSCIGTFYQVVDNTSVRINLGLFFPMAWNPESKRFEIVYNDLVNRVTGYKEDFLSCGNTFRFAAECMNPLFSIAHTGTNAFTIGGTDFCSDETTSGECVFDRTNNPLDKPKYCGSDLRLVNNSAFCGCPNGQVVNASSNSCSGNPSGSMSDSDITGIVYWFTDGWNWLFVVLAIAIISILFPAPVGTVINIAKEKFEEK